MLAYNLLTRIQPDGNNNVYNKSMADEKQVVLDWKVAEEYLKTIEDKVMSYKGKEGYNPFVWLRDKGVNKIREKLNKGVKLPEIHQAIMSLKFSTPWVGKGEEPKEVKDVVSKS